MVQFDISQTILRNTPATVKHGTDSVMARGCMFSTRDGNF